VLSGNVTTSSCAEDHSTVDAKQAQAGGGRVARKRFCDRLHELAARPEGEPADVLRICTRLDEHFDGITAFLVVTWAAAPPSVFAAN
jgi:hypothetical protein